MGHKGLEEVRMCLNLRFSARQVRLRSTRRGKHGDSQLISHTIVVLLRVSPAGRGAVLKHTSRVLVQVYTANVKTRSIADPVASSEEYVSDVKKRCQVRTVSKPSAFLKAEAQRAGVQL